MSEPLISALPSGLEIQVKDIFDWFVFFDIFACGEYKDAIDLAIEHRNYWSINYPFRVVDLGSNVGYFTLYTADQLIRHKIPFFDIQAVEGSLRNAEEMRLRLRQQPTDKLVGKIEILNGVVGKKSGYVDFHTNSNHTLNHVRVVQPRGQEVAFNDQYLDLEGLIKPGRIDLLKIDIEGSEQAFLETYPALVERSSVIVIEIHEKHVDLLRCHDALELTATKSLYSIKQKGDVRLEIWV